MVIVGLDTATALRELARLAPADGAPDDAVRRAAGLRLPESGAAERIAGALSEIPA